ncbi:MAG: hypothetical protein ABFD84_13005 [Candidatus Polarisedimenticolia bacterium]|nr:hypothetical protein [bacterium]
MNFGAATSPARGRVRIGLYLLCASFAVSYLWLPFELLPAGPAYGRRFRFIALSWALTGLLWFVGALMLRGAGRLAAAPQGHEARRLGVASATLAAAALGYCALGLLAQRFGRDSTAETTFAPLGGVVFALVAAAVAGALLWWLRTAEAALAAARAPRGVYVAAAACAGASILCRAINAFSPASIAPAQTLLLAPLGWTTALGCVAALALRLTIFAPALARAAERDGDKTLQGGATEEREGIGEAAPRRRPFSARLLEFGVGFFGFPIGVAFVFSLVLPLGDFAAQTSPFLALAGLLAAFVFLLRAKRTAAALGGLAALVIAPTLLFGFCLALFR